MMEPWTVLWNNMLHLLPYIICQLCYRRFFFLLWRTPIDTYVAVRTIFPLPGGAFLS